MNLEKLIVPVGIGAAVLYFLSSSSTTSLTTTTTPGGITTNIPAAPAVFDETYYLTYQYPAMLAANPNIGNPNYQMTLDEANQYYNNYLGIRQWIATQGIVPKPFQDLQTAVQYHWSNYGVANKCSFLPFTPTNNVPYNVPVKNNNTTGSGGSAQSWVGTAASVAAVVASFLGIDDGNLNATEAEILINGCAIVTDALPMFYGAPGGLALRIDTKMNDLLKQYTK